MCLQTQWTVFAVCTHLHINENNFWRCFTKTEVLYKAARKNKLEIRGAPKRSMPAEVASGVHNMSIPRIIPKTNTIYEFVLLIFSINNTRLQGKQLLAP